MEDKKPQLERGIVHVRERLPGSTKTELVRTQPLRIFAQKGRPRVYKQHGLFWLANGEELSDKQAKELGFDKEAEKFIPDPDIEKAYTERKKASQIQRARQLASRKY